MASPDLFKELIDTVYNPHPSHARVIPTRNPRIGLHQNHAVQSFGTPVMFTLVRLKDAIPVPACELDKPRPLAVANQIELKYSNRVVTDVGLCVCLHEILELKDGLIYVSDSSVHIRAEFTLVIEYPEFVFRKRINYSKCEWLTR
jgi:hypothetical protein